MDPFAGLAEFILGKMKDSTVAVWWRFLFEIGFSAVGSFLMIGGSVLAGSRNWPLGIGSGMVAAAVSMTVLFRKETSRLTRGMLVVLPAEEAAKEIESNVQTITKKE